MTFLVQDAKSTDPFIWDNFQFLCLIYNSFGEREKFLPRAEITHPMGPPGRRVWWFFKQQFNMVLDF